MKSIKLISLAALFLAISGIATAAPGDHELMTGTYNCYDYVPSSSNNDSQNMNVFGSPLQQDYFNCRGGETPNCSANAAVIANSLESSDCTQRTSTSVDSHGGGRTIITVYWVCEGLRKKVLEAVGDACKAMF